MLLLMLLSWSFLPQPPVALAQANDSVALPTFSQVAVGSNHTCALTGAGGVKCWGNNDYGQLGDGTTSSRGVPVDVSGLTSGVVAIGAGGYHTCAVTTAGGVKCWGRGNNGELGYGSWSNTATPLDVSGLITGVKAIGAGAYHTCALTTEGGVKCWGYNLYGQVGNVTDGDAATPVDVSGLSSGVKALSVGGYFNCVLTASDGAKCWGDNGWGQLGIGSENGQPTPVDVNGLTSGVKAIIAGGHHACALLTSGGAKCWGYNGSGQLGSGAMGDTVMTPIDVSSFASGVSSLALGEYHTCALTTNGGVTCTGDNAVGQLGDGTTENKNTPVDVTGLNSGVTAITAGATHTCAIITNGGIKCWGSANDGQLGNDVLGNKNTPVDVSGLTTGVTDITAGGAHTCAVTMAGGVKCWGANGVGQLGDGTQSNKNAPVAVSGIISGMTTVNAGYTHTCALTTAGGVKCWGYNYYGELGNGANDDTNTPVDVSNLASGVSVLSAGWRHTCAVTTAGGAKCWGANATGPYTPLDVSGLISGVLTISTGGANEVYPGLYPGNHTCAVTATGGAKCWGFNGYGQVGNGTFDDAATPVDVSGLTDQVQAISAGGEQFTCALTTAGGVKCWGNNYRGALGVDPSTLDKTNIPVAVSGATSGVAAISAGAAHVCALTVTGGVKCWGNNDYGQLGDGTRVSTFTPVDVSGLTSGVVAIRAGGKQTCALTANGGMKCWGDNTWGQLGDGSAWSTTPVDVVLNPIPTATPTPTNTPTATPTDTPPPTATPTNTPLPTNTLTPIATPTDSSAAHHAIAIAAGDDYTCALTAGGGVKCWGSNAYGTLGDGSTTDYSTTPVAVMGLTSGVQAIAAGFSQTCALTVNGAVKCWGYQVPGGNGIDAVPIAINGLEGGVQMVAPGKFHICALIRSGVQCLGFNTSGQIGQGDDDPLKHRNWYDLPVDVVGLSSGVQTVAAGFYYNCAVTTGQSAVCWGENFSGQLGDGTTDMRMRPVNVSGLTSGVQAIEPSYYHTCALTTDGGLKCWGVNTYGQLGDGTTTDRLTPGDVQGLTSGVQAVAAGPNHTCAITTGGGVKCWGWGIALGDAIGVDRATPSDVYHLNSGVQAISAGFAHTCAVTASGGIKCWGDNAWGQLGDGSTSSGSDAPVDVIGFGDPETPTATATAMPTDTPVPPTATATATNTAMPTGTPTATATNTRIPTNTPTPTPTVTPTNTPLPTATATNTPLPTATSTATPTLAPTGSGLRVTIIEPNHGLNTAPTTVNVRGVDFADPPTVKLGDQALEQVRRMDANQLQAVVPAGLPAGVYDLIVTNPTGQSAVLANAFTVQSDGPALLEVYPERGSASLPNEITLMGSNFADGASVQLGTTPPMTLPVTFISDTLLRATVPNGLTAGLYAITVTNPDGKSNTLAAAYTVLSATVNDDLYSEGNKLWSDPIAPHAQNAVKIGLVVYRQGGKTTLSNVKVRFYLGDPAQGGASIGEGVIPLLGVRDNASTTAVTWTPPTAGRYTLYAQIDPDNTVLEGDETNNLIHRAITVLPPDADLTAPHVDSFTINNGATTTNEQTVTLNTTATDPTTPPPSSGVESLLFVEYEFSQGAGTWAPTQISNWLPYATAHTNEAWPLMPASGMHYLQAWAADKAGNIAAFPARALTNYIPPTDKVGQDQVRIYRINLTAGQHFTARVESSSGDPDLYVWAPDSDTRPPYVSNLAGAGVPDVVSFAAPVTGLYQLEVYGYSTAAYRLQLTTDAVNGAAGQAGGSTTDKPLRTQPALALNSTPGREQSLPTAPTTITPATETPVRTIFLPIVVR
ncbi:MAG: CARDB domain-containing protein [Caldilineaceae bacterium]